MDLRLAQLSPCEIGAPDIAKGLAEVNARNKAAGKKVAIQPFYHAGKPAEGVPRAQYLDQQWLRQSDETAGRRRSSRCHRNRR